MQKIPLNQVIFHGVPNIRSAIDDLRKMDVHGDLKNILSNITKTFKEISPRLINQIATSTIYKRQIQTYLRFPSNDTANQVKLLMDQVERHLNQKIIIARRRDTKQRLAKEKGRIMSFYKLNANQLKLLFDLHNLFLKAQEKLSNDAS